MERLCIDRDAGGRCQRLRQAGGLAQRVVDAALPARTADAEGRDDVGIEAEEALISRGRCAKIGPGQAQQPRSQTRELSCPARPVRRKPAYPGWDGNCNPRAGRRSCPLGSTPISGDLLPFEIAPAGEKPMRTTSTMPIVPSPPDLGEPRPVLRCRPRRPAADLLGSGRRQYVHRALGDQVLRLGRILAHVRRCGVCHQRVKTRPFLDDDKRILAEAGLESADIVGIDGRRILDAAVLRMDRRYIGLKTLRELPRAGRAWP